tara:strand:+ start:17184 stop:17687 length:504 start_codon:yes stop_codon:yes gene_type:complete
MSYYNNSGLKGFYYVTEKIREELQKDVSVNTVTYGNFMDVDLHKQTIFPLSHFMVSNATLVGNIWSFNFDLLVMDIVEISKTYAEGIPEEFRGNNNEQDVLNTQLAVANRLLEKLRRGDLYSDLFQLANNPTCQPFMDRFTNKLAGWTVSFTINVPNDMTICVVPED